jgi:hypothetical protein
VVRTGQSLMIEVGHGAVYGEVVLPETVGAMKA